MMLYELGISAEVWLLISSPELGATRCSWDLRVLHGFSHDLFINLVNQGIHKRLVSTSRFPSESEATRMLRLENTGGCFCKGENHGLMHVIKFIMK